jgi:hypothetical protein
MRGWRKSKVIIEILPMARRSEQTEEYDAEAMIGTQLRSAERLNRMA